MTPLDRLEKLAEKATARPWVHEQCDYYTVISTGPGGKPSSFANVADGTSQADAEFIVSAANALPALLRIARAAARTPAYRFSHSKEAHAVFGALAAAIEESGLWKEESGG